MGSPPSSPVLKCARPPSLSQSRVSSPQVNAEGNAVVNGTTYTLSDTLTAAKLGAGITHDLGSNVFVRAEYAYHRTERTDALRIQYATFGLGVGMLF
jgi:opacity protein-like surface antigen